MDRDSEESSSSSEDEKEEGKAPAVALQMGAPVMTNSSIITDASEPILNTVVGPIYGWLPVPENLPNHPTMAFFGKRRTGKSTTITNLLFHCCRDIPFGLVMSDTAYAGYWEQIVPKRQIVQGLRQDVLNWLIDRQKKAVEKYGVKGE